MERIGKYSLEIHSHPQVYEPDDDSYLMASAVIKYAKGSVLEVGCANGMESILAAKLPAVKSVLGIDINAFAVSLAEKNAKANHVEKKCKFFECDVFNCSALVGNRFHTIICNPPYLPTKKDEVLAGPLNYAFDGGLDGRKFINPFLKWFAPHLEPKGQLLLLCSSLSGTDKTISLLKKNGFTVSVVGSRKFFFEELTALRVFK